MPVRDNGTVDDLNYRSLAGLIDLGNFILPGEKVEDRFEVFDVSQLSDIFDPCLLHVAFGDKSVGRPLRRSAHSLFLRPQTRQLLFGDLEVGVFSGCERAHTCDLNFLRGHLST